MSSEGEAAGPVDVAAVTDLLGRAPAGRFRVVVRDREGSPVVIRNAPLLEDGTPMPTRYWLVGRRLREAVGRLEASGGVRAAERAVAPEAVASAHAIYATERDRALPPGYGGPRPFGGVGGTRRGVKCLHAHFAWYLAGGADPVGRWTASRLAPGAGETVGVIDCGTNSTRLLVLGSDGVPLAREMRLTRLGEGVDATGRLRPEAIQRTLEALVAYKATADALEVSRLRAVATSAARDAANAEELFDRAAAVLGSSLELLGGDEEGRLAYRGATKDLDPFAGPYLVVDLGGGSTELVAGPLSAGGGRTDGGGLPDPKGAPEGLVSLPLGCVRVSERYFRSDPPGTDELEAATRHVAEVVADAVERVPALRGPREMVAVAGTSATLVALSVGLGVHDRARLHLGRLGRDEVGELLGSLAGETIEERRRRPGLEPGRADVIVGGAVVLAGVMDGFGSDELVHSEADILDGLAYDLLG